MIRTWRVALQILTRPGDTVLALLELLVLHRLSRSFDAGWRPSRRRAIAIYALGDLLPLGAREPQEPSRTFRALLSWSLFFFVGIRLRRRPEIFDGIGRRKAAISLVLAGSYALFLFALALEDRRFGYNPRKQVLLAGLPFHVVGAVPLLAALRALDRSGRGRGLLAWLAAAGTDTYGIYLSHTAVLIGVFAAARGLGWTTHRGVETPLLAIATWIASVTLVRSARRFAPGWLKFAVLGERGSGPAAPA